MAVKSPYLILSVTYLIFLFLIDRFSYQALYSYIPQNDDELELRDGDIVDVMEKCDDGWFVGKWPGPTSLTSRVLKEQLGVMNRAKEAIFSAGKSLLGP